MPNNTLQATGADLNGFQEWSSQQAAPAAELRR
jgi:hypothetical protein